MKLKTHKGAAKRLKRTSLGQVKFRRSNRSHINTRMSSQVKRSLRRQGRIGKTHLKMTTHLLAK